MDEEVEMARREFERAPGDEQAARRYQVALERSGRHEDVRARFRMAFQCDAKWDQMDYLDVPGDQPDAIVVFQRGEPRRRTVDGRRRQCRRCDKVVTMAWTAEDLLALAREGACARIVAKADSQGPAWVVDHVARDGTFSFVEAPRKGRALPCIIHDLPPPPRPFAGFEPMGRLVRG